jgi:hypothetical protein
MTLPTLKRGAYSAASHPPPKLQPQTHKKQPAPPIGETPAIEVFNMTNIAKLAIFCQQIDVIGVEA